MPLIRNLRHGVQYSFWHIFNRKSKAKKYARIALKRGNLKEAALFWAAAEKYFPNDIECTNAKNICLATLENGGVFLDFSEQGSMVDNIQSLLNKGSYLEAIKCWKELSDKKPIPSGPLYSVSGEILKQIIYNNLEFSDKETEKSLLKFLCYQNPVLIESTNKYPAICNILFRHKTSDKESYLKFLKYIKTLFDEAKISADKNVSSACLSISFDLVDQETKKNLMAIFFDEFSVYKQWGMILFADNEENIQIFRNLLDEKISNLEEKTPEQIFSYLYLTSAIDNPVHRKLMDWLKNSKFTKKTSTPFLADLNFLSGKKDLYEECLKDLGLQNLLPEPQNKISRDQKLKIAVCVSGQLRGYKKALASWKNFCTQGHELTYFVHTWKHVGRKYPSPPSDARSLSGKFLQEWRNAWFKLESAEMEKRYQNFFKLFSEGDLITEDDLKKTYNSNHVVVEDDTSEKFRNFSNSEKMYYKIFECHKMARNSGQEFDLIIRIRPDRELIANEEIIDWHKIYNYVANKKRLVLDSGPYLHPHCEYVVGDQIAIGTTTMMDRYAMTYKITEYAKKTRLSGLPKEHVAHINFSYSTLYQDIEIKNFNHLNPGFLSCANLLDPEILPPKEVLDTIKKDIRDSQDPTDISLLNAAIYDAQNNS